MANLLILGTILTKFGAASSRRFANCVSSLAKTVALLHTDPMLNRQRFLSLLQFYLTWALSRLYLPLPQHLTWVLNRPRLLLPRHLTWVLNRPRLLLPRHLTLVLNRPLLLAPRHLT